MKIILLTISTLCMLNAVEVPNTFVDGTPAFADEVNENFTALKDAVNANAVVGGANAASVSATEVRVTTNAADITSLSNSVTTNTADLTSLSNSVIVNAADVTTLSNSVTTNATSIDIQATRVSALEVAQPAVVDPMADTYESFNVTYSKVTVGIGAEVIMGGDSYFIGKFRVHHINGKMYHVTIPMFQQSDRDVYGSVSAIIAANLATTNLLIDGYPAIVKRFAQCNVSYSEDYSTNIKKVNYNSSDRAYAGVQIKVDGMIFGINLHMSGISHTSINVSSYDFTNVSVTPPVNPAVEARMDTLIDLIIIEEQP